MEGVPRALSPSRLYSPRTEPQLLGIPGALCPKVVEAVLPQAPSPAPAPPGLGLGCDAERLLGGEQAA